ncbi:hypothetical protein DER45DRAFT_619164 [Fusarium avenaceum]|nr:hypothetical protein DER45DRAFT_619164 [Fusarium avenaceum]
MRTSLFYALNGALGVVASDSLAYFKFETGKEGHRSLDGCGKHGKHKWVPDPATFVFPQNDFKPGNSWDLCVDTPHCAPHEALSKVTFDFKDNGIVFDFKHIDHYKYEDVEVYVERGQPTTDGSFKYSKESDHCKAKSDYKEVKCHIPFFSLTDGGSYNEVCPIENNGGWKLHIKVKATIAHGHKKYELYSRTPDLNEKYFTLSYTCAECKDYKEGKLELIEAEEAKVEEVEEEEEEEAKKKEKKYKEEDSEEAEAEAEEEEEEKKKHVEEKKNEHHHEHHHKHHHNHGHKHAHGHQHAHGHLHKELHHHDHHHKDHHKKLHEHKDHHDGKEHHKKHDHYDPGYEHEHEHHKEHEYEHHDPSYYHEHHKHHDHHDPGHHHEHYDPGHHHDHHDPGHHHDLHEHYKHHDYYDASRHHDLDTFLDDFFKHFGYHYRHHDILRTSTSTSTVMTMAIATSTSMITTTSIVTAIMSITNMDIITDIIMVIIMVIIIIIPTLTITAITVITVITTAIITMIITVSITLIITMKVTMTITIMITTSIITYDPGHHDGHYDHHYKRSDEHHDTPLVFLYKEKEESVSAQIEHLLKEKVHKGEIEPHVYHALLEDLHKKKHGGHNEHEQPKQYHHGHYEHKPHHEFEGQHETKPAAEHEEDHVKHYNPKAYHDKQKHEEAEYRKKELAKAELNQALEKYYAAHSVNHEAKPERLTYKLEEYKQHEKPEENHHHVHHEHKPEEPKHYEPSKQYDQGHYDHEKYAAAEKKHDSGHYVHKPEEKHHHGHYEQKHEQPKHYHHGHHEHKPEEKHYEGHYEGHYEQKHKEPETYHHSHHGHYKYKPEEGEENENPHVAYERLVKSESRHHRTSKEKVFGIAPKGYPLEKNHFLQSPHHLVHPHKRSALHKSYEEAEHIVEVNTEKVETYIEKAEYNIIKAINKTLCKAIKLAGENPSQETIQKLILKVEKAIKYIVVRNLKKTIAHIIEIDGVEEPSKHEIHNHILKAVHKIVKSADTIFEKTIEALGEDPTEAEVKLALKKVEKLLAKIVDKTVRKTLISLFELEEETEEEWYHEKEKRADEAKAAEVESKEAKVEAKDAEVESKAAEVESKEAKVKSKAAEVESKAAAVESKEAKVESKAAETTGKQERQASVPIYSRPAKILQCGKRSRVYGHSDHLKIEEAVEVAVESDAAKLVGNTDKKPRSIRQSKRAKRDGRFYNGYVPECKGKTIKAYGVDGQNTRALKDLAFTTHPKTCHLHSGDYLKYTHHELKNTVYGKLSEAGGAGQKYGNYFIEIVKNPHGYHNDIVISLDVNDKHKYDATEAKVFVGCEGSREHLGKENICVEKSYPYLSVAEKGLNEFVFAVPDKYMCHGGHYNIAIVVDICDNKE